MIEKAALSGQETKQITIQSTIKAYSFTGKSEDFDPYEDCPDFEDPEDEFDYRFRNPYGCLRVGMTRKHLNEHFDIEKICRAYGEWVATDEWLQLSMSVNFFNETKRKENIFVPCVKRGNDAYQARVNKRISEMGDFEDWPLDIAGARNNMKTRVLFVTLTQDTKRFEGKHKYPAKLAWQLIGKEYNAWTASIRQKFGKFAEFRVWESSKEGFPHVHAILVFDEKKFDGFIHNNKMRIREKRHFAAPWHSHVDVQGVTNFKRGMSEILKYLTKDIGIKNRKEKNSKNKPKTAFLNSPKGRKTLALTWFFNKRAFAVSGFFRDLTTGLHNSNTVAYIPRFYQSDLWNGFVESIEYELIDIVPWKIVAAMGGVG